MAHIEKYKAPSIGKLCGHYRRWDGIDRPDIQRENIDKSRTHLNYVIGNSDASWDTVKKRIEDAESRSNKKVRKDAVVMADVVITAPRNVPEDDLMWFFALCYDFIGNQVGHDNLMGGYVHMDETTPHIHIPFTPVLDGRFCYKKLCPRSFYQSFHTSLGDHLERKMRYRPEIELAEDRRAEKVLSEVPQAKLDDARAAILDPALLERAAIEEEIAETKKRLEFVRQLKQAEIQEGERLTERIGFLESTIARVRERIEQVGERIAELKESIMSYFDKPEPLPPISPDWEWVCENDEWMGEKRYSYDYDGLHVEIKASNRFNDVTWKVFREGKEIEEEIGMAPNMELAWRELHQALGIWPNSDPWPHGSRFENGFVAKKEPSKKEQALRRAVAAQNPTQPQRSRGRAR